MQVSRTVTLPTLCVCVFVCQCICMSICVSSYLCIFYVYAFICIFIFRDVFISIYCIMQVWMFLDTWSWTVSCNMSSSNVEFFSTILIDFSRTEISSVSSHTRTAISADSTTLGQINFTRLRQRSKSQVSSFLTCLEWTEIYWRVRWTGVDNQVSVIH